MKKMFWIYLGYTREGDKRTENVWACSNCGEGLRLKYDDSDYKETRTDICPRCGLKPTVAPE